MEVKRVKVKFVHTFDTNHTGDKLYEYLTWDGGLEVGDLVVVETVAGYAVAEVRTLPSRDLGKARNYIVQKVDLQPLEDFKAVQAQKEFLKAEIDVRIQEMSYVQQVEMFAEKDPKLKELLDDYAGLNTDK